MTAPASSAARSSTQFGRYAAIAGYALLVVWVVWWADALYELNLWASQHTLIHVPLFGADFFSQSDLAAREWASGIDPYASRGHLFHYPPLVIRLFLWTPLFEEKLALRIWIVVCILLMVAGTWAAVRVRKSLPVGQLPLSLALAFVLFSFPVVFELERANFDLITLAALLIALWLFSKGTNTAEFLAGCVLAAGPWVKLYPGLMGLGLVALRRYRATAGFVVACAAIGLAAPSETMRSFDVLRLAVERVKNVSKIVPQSPWGHSLSVAWLKIGQAASSTFLGKAMLAIPMDAAAGAFVLGLAGWVCYRLYRLPRTNELLYPLLLWLNALGSCVGAIANDYSLAFLPLAAIAVFSLKDGWFVRIGMALLVIWWQPLDVKLDSGVLLAIKVLGLVVVGMSIVKRAEELSTSTVTEPVSSTAGSAEPTADALPTA